MIKSENKIIKTIIMETTLTIGTILIIETIKDRPCGFQVHHIGRFARNIYLKKIKVDVQVFTTFTILRLSIHFHTFSFLDRSTDKCS